MRKNTQTLTTLAAVAVLTMSCASQQLVSTADDLSAVLDGIKVGESSYVTLVGELRPYSGSNPKGTGLSEIAVGTRTLLIHTHGSLHKDEEAPYLNKKVSARIRISHFPLADSHPASQIGGHWVTEIKDLRLLD